MDFTISGTATNAGKARTLIQRRDLERYGFGCGAAYTVKRWRGKFILNATKAGERKVAKLTDKRRGHTYQTIDLRYPLAERAEMFGNADRLKVTVRKNQIIISAA